MRAVWHTNVSPDTNTLGREAKFDKRIAIGALTGFYPPCIIHRDLSCAFEGLLRAVREIDKAPL